MATGDAFLNYGELSKAEEFYTSALNMPEADMAKALTRLGIAQLYQGKTAEAKSTFAQVQGSREPIAALWIAYANSLTTPTSAVAAPTVDASAS